MSANTANNECASEGSRPEEIEVYVCYEHEKTGYGTCNDPVLLRYDASGDKELVGFKAHPMRQEILALADLAGRETEGVNDGTWMLDESGRPRFSKNFKLPAEWFHGCDWKD